MTRLQFDSARFAISIAEPAEIKRAPLKMVPEAAFVGRSNAGKSSVINLLTRRRRLAFSSRTPGRTQLLNFFPIWRRGEPPDTAEPGAYLVDLPGYGFAKINAETRVRWDDLIGTYLQTRRLLRAIVVVMDARHPFMPADDELLRWLGVQPDAGRLKIHVLLNKIDKLTRSEQAKTVASATRHATTLPAGAPLSVQPFSAERGDGLPEFAAFLDDALLT
jgi:GTP-binding protein